MFWSHRGCLSQNKNKDCGGSQSLVIKVITKHPPHLSVQGMHYINFYAAFFSALCRASDSLAYLEHRDSGDRETFGNEQLIELECAGRDVKLLYYLEAFLFAAAR